MVTNTLWSRSLFPREKIVPDPSSFWSDGTECARFTAGRCLGIFSLDLNSAVCSGVVQLYLSFFPSLCFSAGGPNSLSFSFYSSPLARLFTLPLPIEVFFALGCGNFFPHPLLRLLSTLFLSLRGAGERIIKRERVASSSESRIDSVTFSDLDGTDSLAVSPFRSVSVRNP